MSTIIYRVQDREGRGPWRPGFSGYWVEDRSPEEYAALKAIYQECPDALRRLTKGMHCGCGCSTVEQLRRWVHCSEYYFLRIYGYQAVSLEVDSIVCETSLQCLFQRSAPLWQGAEPFLLYEVVLTGSIPLST